MKGTETRTDDSGKKDLGAREEGGGSSGDLTASTGIPTPESLKEAPPQVKKQVLEMMAATISSGHVPHPLLERIEPGHIDKFLDYSHADDKQEHGHRQSERWFRLVYSLLFLASLFGLITLLLPSNQPLLEDLLKTIAVFAGGFGAGYGYKSVRSQRS